MSANRLGLGNPLAIVRNVTNRLRQASDDPPADTAVIFLGETYSASPGRTTTYIVSSTTFLDLVDII